MSPSTPLRASAIILPFPSSRVVRKFAPVAVSPLTIQVSPAKQVKVALLRALLDDVLLKRG